MSGDLDALAEQVAREVPSAARAVADLLAADLGESPEAWRGADRLAERINRQIMVGLIGDFGYEATVGTLAQILVAVATHPAAIAARVARHNDRER